MTLDTITTSGLFAQSLVSPLKPLDEP